ncbi:hypothetical protein, partial [Microbispora sp. ATCC PTA-5024]|uniref:hypothetical protein n=1 Tax=Microbispora sp. ATCC PTA-5024 TaxID=316330 RepID=UPI0018DB95EF
MGRSHGNGGTAGLLAAAGLVVAFAGVGCGVSAGDVSDKLAALTDVNTWGGGDEPDSGARPSPAGEAHPLPSGAGAAGRGGNASTASAGGGHAVVARPAPTWWFP